MYRETLGKEITPLTHRDSLLACKVGLISLPKETLILPVLLPFFWLGTSDVDVHMLLQKSFRYVSRVRAAIRDNLHAFKLAFWELITVGGDGY